jgi:hypothetical protein
MTRLYTALLLMATLFSSAVSAQVFPYAEAFDSYTASQPLNGNGGIVAGSHVIVMPRGVVGNCAEFQMSPTATRDSLVSPIIGPLTANSVTSFYFRVVTYSGGTPSLYTLTGTDGGQIIVGFPGFSYSLPQYQINSSTQNTTANYIKVVVPIPPILAGGIGQFKILTSNPSGHNWLLELDSLVVRDTLQIPPVLTSVVINDSCRGDSTGSIRVSATGATPPYTYHWSTTNVDTAFLNHLAGGAYSVTVTDALGATAVLYDTVREPQFQLLLDSLVKTNVLCFGSATGTAQIYAKGGTPAYSYDWSTNPVQHGQQAQNVPAGNYSVTVTDSKGCIVTATTQLTQPTALTLALSSTPSSGSNGTATAIANGGTSPFTYLWTPGGQTTPIVTGLAPGEYQVQVTDGNSCILVDSVRVTNLIGINEVNDNALKLYPNPASDHLYITIDGQTQSPVSVSISDMSGRSVITNETVTNSMNISSLTNGIYLIKVSAAGNTYIKRIVIQK